MSIFISYPITDMKQLQILTLTNLCKSYLDTNYISVEDIVDVFDYEQDEKILERFRKIMEPVRDERFEKIQNGEELDLDDVAYELARKLRKLSYEIYDEMRIENIGIEIGKKVLAEGKQGLKENDLREYVWWEAFNMGNPIDEFDGVMKVVRRIVSNWYCMQ